MDWQAHVRQALSGGRLPDDDVIEELAQHAADRWQAAKAGGRSDEEALAHVDRQLRIWAEDAGNLHRRTPSPSPAPPPLASPSPWSGLLQEIRYTARVLRRQPGHALASTLTIALGIAAVTVIVSVTYGVLLKPLPWPESDRLVRLAESRRGGVTRFGAIMTNGTFNAWRARPTTVEGLVALSDDTPTLTGFGAPRRLHVATATAELFPVLRARPLFGRVFTAAEEPDSKEGVIVLSHGLWQSQFASDPHIVGKIVRLNDRPVKVLGVMPPGWTYPDPETEAWMPFNVPPASENGISVFRAIARLKPGVTVAQAAAEGSARGQAAAGSTPPLVINAVFGSKGAVEIAAKTILDYETGAVRPALLVLLAAVVLLLVTATANVANLQLVRATGRRRDLAIRAAIGAGTTRLMRQCLVESVMLALVGGIAGLAIAAALVRALPLLLPSDFPRATEIGLYAPVVFTALGLSLVSGVTFGLLPALQARRVNLVSTLSEDGLAPVGGSVRSRTARARALLIAGQVAIACLLLTGGALLARSFQHLAAADLGFRPENVLSARLPIEADSYTDERRRALMTAILDQLRARPGVVVAGFTTGLPLAHGPQSLMAFTMPARDGSGEMRAQAAERTISPGYIKALGLRVFEGRAFTETDTKTSRPVVMVNRAFARQFLKEPVAGQELPLSFSAAGDKAEIIGVLEDVKDRGATDPAMPEIYVSYLQLKEGLPFTQPTITVRTTGDPAGLTADLRSIVGRLDSSLVLEDVQTMTNRVSQSVAKPRLYALLVGGFAMLALVIAAVGLFSVLAYTVAQRTREIGVRSALGARPGRIVGLVLVQAAAMVLTGLAVGLGASLLLLRSLSRLLYGITAYDGATYAAVAVVLLLLAGVACVVPAQRAARMDPLKALRS